MFTRAELLTKVNEFRPERMMDGKFEALPVRFRTISSVNVKTDSLRSQTPGSRLVSVCEDASLVAPPDLSILYAA